MANILELKEREFLAYKDMLCDYDDPEDYDAPEVFKGFYIKLDNNMELYFGIKRDRLCCEEVGVYITPDESEDLNKYIGSELLNYDKLVELYLPIKKEKVEDSYSREKLSTFIDVETSAGKLQLTLYNEHNGHYAHKVVFLYIQELDNDSGKTLKQKLIEIWFTIQNKGEKMSIKNNAKKKVYISAKYTDVDLFIKVYQGRK